MRKQANVIKLLKLFFAGFIVSQWMKRNDVLYKNQQQQQKMNNAANYKRKIIQSWFFFSFHQRAPSSKMFFWTIEEKHSLVFRVRLFFCVCILGLFMDFNIVLYKEHHIVYVYATERKEINIWTQLFNPSPKYEKYWIINFNNSFFFFILKQSHTHKSLSHKTTNYKPESSIIKKKLFKNLLMI